MLAAQGVCNLDHGNETIEDEGLVARLRAKAGRMKGQTLGAALVLTALVLACPA